MTVEHLPWIGDRYASQPAGGKLLIAGFSHHGRFSDTAEDNEDFTNQVMYRWALNGGLRFFNAIAEYFGEQRIAFWSRVAFINTLASTVGDERYSDGSPEQRAAAKPRLLRLIDELRPDRIFVFTAKGRKDLWPDYTGHLKNGTLPVDGVGEVECGTYAHPDGEAIAFGLRHPQYAVTADMRASVAAALRYCP